jgi:hypothetical protein
LRGLRLKPVDGMKMGKKPLGGWLNLRTGVEKGMEVVEVGITVVERIGRVVGMG